MKTSPAQCLRWIALFEQQEVGDVVGQDDLAWFEQHQAQCARCSAESNALSLLAVPERLTMTQDDVRAGDVVIRSLAKTAGARRLWQLAAVATLAVAASGLFVLVRPKSPAPFFTVAEQSGEVFVDGHPTNLGGALAVGQRLSVKTGRACIAVATGGRLCLAANTDASAWATDGAERTLHLSSGEVRVEMGHQPPGLRVGVHTDEGVVLAIGTVFRVARQREVEVEVSEGRVLTRSRLKQEELGPGKMHFLRAHGLVRVSEVDPVTTDSFQSVDAGVTVSGVSSSPIVQAAEQLPTHSTKPLVTRTGKRNVIRGHQSSTGTAPPASEPVVQPSVSPSSAVAKNVSASELLRDARVLRAEGRAAESAVLFDRVIALGADADEGQAALLALSDLELGPLRRPARALVHVRQYLDGHGPLKDEAAFRELRALSMLGRRDEVIRKRATFLAEFPNSPHVDAVKAAQSPGQ